MGYSHYKGATMHGLFSVSVPQDMNKPICFMWLKSVLKPSSKQTAWLISKDKSIHKASVSFNNGKKDSLMI